MSATQTVLAGERNVLARLAEARKNTDELFRIIRTESLYERPIPERHRIIFYLGHLEAFDWNLFRGRDPSLESFAPELDKLFAFGIDPVGGGLPTDKPEEWPAVRRGLDYNRRVRKELDASFERHEFARKSESGASLETLSHVAIEHRLMHLETLAYLFHQLPHERKNRQAQSNLTGAFSENEMVEIPRGKTKLGLRRSDTSPFGWDNEFDGFEIEVPSFRIDRYMVTNGEFLTFLEDGGYYDPSLWSAEDWQWKESSNVHHPAFWRRDEEDWQCRGMFEDTIVPLNWPVYVSHAEASAYARWAGKSLPSEAQWQRAAHGAPHAASGNFDFRSWDPQPVDA